METLYSPPSGFTSDASMPGGRGPRTPPITPARVKRRPQRSDSPVSIAGSTAGSIHPLETTSPAKKTEPAPQSTTEQEQGAEDNFTVQELTEEDVGYSADIDVRYPEDIEEVSSDTDHNPDNSSATDISDTENTTTGLVRRFSRLKCNTTDPNSSNDNARRRSSRQFDRRKRTDSRLYKRPHHETVVNAGSGSGGDAAAADSDAIDDHDFEGSQRRLRRRTKGPMDEIVFADLPRWSSPEAASAGQAPGSGSPTLATKHGGGNAGSKYVNIVYPHPFDSDEMDIG